jgi:hypothetical protein
MQPKWIIVALIWSAFLLLVGPGQRFGKAADLTVIGLYCAVLVAASVAVLVQWVRHWHDPKEQAAAFWRFRGYPRWFIRFALDEPDKHRRPGSSGHAAAWFPSRHHIQGCNRTSRNK